MDSFSACFEILLLFIMLFIILFFDRLVCVLFLDCCHLRFMLLFQLLFHICLSRSIFLFFLQSFCFSFSVSFSIDHFFKLPALLLLLCFSYRSGLSIDARTNQIVLLLHFFVKFGINYEILVLSGFGLGRQVFSHFSHFGLLLLQLSLLLNFFLLQRVL